jgi:hypothetical protein
MTQHLLRVERPAAEFGPLIAAMRQAGERAGWLELNRDGAGPLPESLATAASAGVLRAVAAGGDSSVAVKPMRGAPVLRDLLREHFRGCRLVLVVGEVEAPLLEPHGQDWTVRANDGTATRRTTEKLIAALRKPRPFDNKT